MLYRWDYSIQILTHNTITDSLRQQEISVGSLAVHEPHGTFTGDTLWVGFELQEGESRQIYLNGAVPDDGTLSAPISTTDITATFRLREVNDGYIIESNQNYRSGYLTDIRGLVRQQLTPQQMRGAESINLLNLPAGSYLILLCSDGCSSRVVQKL